MRNPNQWATGTDANPDPQFFVQLAAQRLLCCLTGLALATRELPRAGQITVIAAPRQQHAALTILHHCRADVDRFSAQDRTSTRLNSSHSCASRMPSSARKQKNTTNNAT